MFPQLFKKNYNSQKPFDGILKYLRAKATEYSQDWKSYYEPIAPEGHPERNNPLIPVTQDDDGGMDYWHSQDIENQYFSVDFKNSKILLENYTYRAHSIDFQEKWQILGSNDNVNWEIICFPTGFTQPAYAYHTFNFPCKAKKPYRIIKYLSIMHRYSGDHRITFYGLEFFGKYYPPGSAIGVRCSNRCNKRNNEVFFFFLIALIYR